MIEGHAMFTVAPTRPELPIISMPMMVGDAGGFTPRCAWMLMWSPRSLECSVALTRGTACSDVVQLFNYTVTSEERIEDLELLIQEALDETATWCAGRAV